MVEKVFLGQGFVIDVDAKMKDNTINWPTQPEEIGGFVALLLYLLTVLSLHLNVSSVREPVYIFHPSNWYSSRHRGAF